MQSYQVRDLQGGGKGLKLEVHFGNPKLNVAYSPPGLNVSTGIPVVRDAGDIDPYTGDYTVTPSSEVQVLETNGKRMTDDVTVEAMPQGSVSQSAFGLALNGVPISVSDSGLISVDDETSEQFELEFTQGYIDSIPPVGVQFWVSGEKQLPTSSAINITPSDQTQTFDVKNKYMTGNIVVDPIPSNYGLITWNGSYLTIS